MARGQLRVYLGLAPGVGKTYRMLDEGWRRRERGADVVVALVETHGRAKTESQLRDLEVVPRIERDYRGTTLSEMDLDAVLARRPEVALVDELAHTNVPGGRHEKRWQDVEELLDAGIDVITTVNIQHLESVNDVVEKITGVVQRETVPDVVVRRAEQIELVDITPEALRRRMAHGNIYPAEKIDASLSNFFRSGNLTALRELSLLWLADRVEDTLQDYLDAHGIAETWETRERLVVAVTGTPAADEVLLRRAARIAARNHADVVAVHVIDAGSMSDRNADTTHARTLVEEFEGTFHEVIDEDVAGALVAFARAERGTQIVLGSSRRRRPWHVPGVIEKVLRQARDLDVHIIAVDPAAAALSPGRQRAPDGGGARVIGGMALALVVMPLLTVAMAQAHAVASLSTVFLVYLVAVLALASWGGMIVGVTAALCAAGLENYYFVPPVHTLVIARPDDAVAIVAFLAFGVGASLAMTQFRRRSADAQRARAEAELLSEAVATVTASRDDLRPLLDTLREVFAAQYVALMTLREGRWVAELVSGEAPRLDEPGVDFPVDDETRLRLSAVGLENQDRRLVAAFAARVASALETQRLLDEAREMRQRVRNDALRIGLLRSVAHDLTPSLAAIESNVAALRSSVPEPRARERVEAVWREVDLLTRLVTNLLDSGRLGAQRITPRRWRVRVDEMVARAVAAVERHGGRVDVDVPGDLPALVSDPDLLERVLVNVVSNAVSFSPAAQPARVTAGCAGGDLEILVVDRGPGTRDPRRRIPVDEEGDGAGEVDEDLGLSVARGFARLLGGDLRYEDTPGGGLTVVVTLPLEGEVKSTTVPSD